MHLSAEAVGLVPALALGYALVARAERPGRLRIVAAAAALALVFAAFFTELQPLALHTFLWAHLLQNVVLAEWAPALLVLAVPPALGRRAARVAGASARSSRCRSGSSRTSCGICRGSTTTRSSIRTRCCTSST